jgi:AcrR family transcriptional regulator
MATPTRAHRRLTRDDWVEAGARALSSAGPDGVAVQPLARELGTTKGSFYWHFSTRDELLRAALERWVDLATDVLIEEVERAVPGKNSQTARQRAELLLTTVTSRSQENPGEVRLLAAVDHPDVERAVAQVTERRIGYLASLLRASGLTTAAATRRATLAYAAYLGYTQLSASVPAVLPSGTRGRKALATELADLVLQ